MRQTKAEKQAAAAALDERRRAAYRYRLMGATFDQIATRLGTNRETARLDVAHVLNELNAENKAEIEALRAMENQRLDVLQLAFFPSAERADLDAANIVLKVSDRRCKLNGLYAPFKIEDATPSAENEAKRRAFRQAHAILTDGELELLEALELKIEARANELLNASQDDSDD